ncbi:hypothetical protein FSP39_020601 [Pinctada imbricata]|uniref:Uncharacterized protein n=1 Tax=Pinctada imbricata TaxID=66713 RepID=A0AA89C3Y1_PINIB|nr:hypothetical protein FSP39_020601 [Pinctada imbricata]
MPAMRYFSGGMTRVSIINHHNSGPSSNLEPMVDCELAERLTTLDRECNFTAESEVVTKTNEITTTENTQADCTCLCPLTTDTFPVNMTLSEQVDWLRTTLSIDRKGTALVKRSKISASDDRVSAQGLGYAGGIILILFLGGIVSLDLSRLFKDAQLGFKRCRRRMKMFVRAKAK